MFAPSRAAVTLLRSIGRRWKQRPDSEHEQAFIRIVIVSIFAGYAAFSSAEEGRLDIGLILGVSYLLVSCVYFTASLVWPTTISPVRRLTAMVTDFSMLSAFLHFGGAPAAPFYPIYLWVSLGNGFRYGLRYLGASIVVSTATFGIVLAATEFWLGNLPLGIGLLVALIIIPVYSATLIKKLTEAKAQAEAASEAKSRFLAIVSHELRTPLNVVIGTADVLADMRLGREQAAMVQTIRRSGTALLSLIESVLDFSKIEAGRTAVNRVPFDIHVHLAELVDSFTFQARQKDLTLSAWISPEVPATITGDWSHLRQVLTNLLANAIKFTEAGGVTLTVSPQSHEDGTALVLAVTDTGVGIAPEHRERIFEGFAQADESIARRYGGTGLGLAIARQLIELMDGRIELESTLGAGSTFRVFLPLSAPEATEPAAADYSGCSAILIARDHALIEAFERAVPAQCPTLTVSNLDEARRAITSSGREYHAVLVDLDAIAGRVGLSALMASCPGHRFGFVTVGPEAAPSATTWEHVSTVPPDAEAETIRTALHIAAAFAGALAASVAGALSRTPHRRGLRILVAEDQELNRTLIETILRRAGHEPHLVENGELALDSLAEGAFDIAILDVNMPLMSGIDVARLHRMSELGGNRTPLVALSADATLDTMRICEEAGIDAYLTKPIAAGKLLQTIDELAGEKGEAADSNGDTAPTTLPEAVIADITEHPMYAAMSSAAVDWQALRNLELIGGEDFLRSILSDYGADAEDLIGRIRLALHGGDRTLLRDECHALRSSSGNVGARSICRTCDELRALDESRYGQAGSELVDRLALELETYKAEAKQFLGSREQRGGRGL